jgi:hypothetical protein
MASSVVLAARLHTTPAVSAFRVSTAFGASSTAVGGRSHVRIHRWLSHECEDCAHWKPLFTHYCDQCAERHGL